MPKHHVSKSYFIEARQELQGKRACKPLITESASKSEAEYHRSCASRQKQHEPLDQLPPQYLVYPRKPCRNVPRFHFGVGVTFQQLHDYSVQQCLVPEKYYNNPFYGLETAEAAVKYLDRISGVNLYLEPVRHPEYSWIVARFSNYTWYHEELEERQEHSVIDLIRRELKIRDMPQWHHNISP